jgi:hypothetical protein
MNDITIYYVISDRVQHILKVTYVMAIAIIPAIPGIGIFSHLPGL